VSRAIDLTPEPTDNPHLPKGQCAERSAWNQPEDTPVIMKPLDPTPSEIVAAHATAPCSPTEEEPVRLIVKFVDDAEGACALAETVRTATRRWGIRWAGERARRLAHTQATWLLAHDHPELTHLYLHIEYASVRRLLTIMVGDPGSMLPAFAVGDQWRASLAGAVSPDAFHQGGTDRRLRCFVRVRAPWRMRRTWDTDRLDGAHPEHTFEDCDGQDVLRRTLATVLRQDAVRAAHWQGPDDRDEVWHEPGEMPDGVGGVAA